MAKTSELEKLQRRAVASSHQAAKAGEHDIAQKFLEIAAKLDQKIQGHRANKRRK